MDETPRVAGFDPGAATPGYPQPAPPMTPPPVAPPPAYPGAVTPGYAAAGAVEWPPAHAAGPPYGAPPGAPYGASQGTPQGTPHGAPYGGPPGAPYGAPPPPPAGGPATPPGFQPVPAAGWPPAGPPAPPGPPGPPAWQGTPAYDPAMGGAPVAVAPPPPAPWAPTPPGAMFQAFNPATAPSAAPLKRQRDGIRREATVLVVLLLVIGVIGGVQRLRAGRDSAEPVASSAPKSTFTMPPALEDLNAPPSVGGERRFNSRFTHGFALALRKTLPNKGRFAEIEFYGDQRPIYAIVGGSLTKKSSRAWFDEIGRSTATMRVSRPRALPRNLVCATLSSSAGTGSICAWSGTRSDGMVFGFEERNIAALASVTVTARADLERGF